MDSNSKFPLSASLSPPPPPLLPIRAPLTLHDYSHSDSDSDSYSYFEDEGSPPPPTLRVMPVAHLSTLDDDNQQDSEHEMENEDQVPSVAAAPPPPPPPPRVKVLDDVEDETVANFMFLNSNKFTFFNDTGSFDFSQTIDDNTSGSSVRIANAFALDQVVGDHRVAYEDEYSSIATDTDVMSPNSQVNFNHDQFAKARVLLNGLEADNLILKLFEVDSTTQTKLDFDTREATENIECGRSTTQRIAADQSQGFAFGQRNECEKLVMPLAHLSTYDDDDDNQQDSEEEMEDVDQLLSVPRVPQNFVAAPRIRVRDVEEQNVENYMFMNSLSVNQSLIPNKFTFSNDMGSDNFTEAEDDIDSVGIGNTFVVDEHDSYEYAIATATDSDVMPQCSHDNLNSDRFDKARVVVNELEKEKLIPEFIEIDSTIRRKSELHTREASDMVEGTSITDDDTCLLKSNFEEYSDSRMEKENISSVADLQEQVPQLHTHSSMAGDVSHAFVDNIECCTTQRTAADGSQHLNFDQQSEPEKLVSITESMINSKAKFHDSSASFETNDDACEGNKVHNVESFELLQERTYLENDLTKTVSGGSQEDELFCEYLSHENVKLCLNLGDTVKEEATVDLKTINQEWKGDSCTPEGDAEGLMSESLEQFKEHISALSILLSSKGVGKSCQEEQTIRSSRGKVNLNRDEAKRQSNYVASGGECADEPSVIFLKDQASFSSLPHCEAPAGFNFKHNISEKEKEKIQKIQDISVQFLRLVQRVNLSPEDSLVSKVLCTLVADIGMRSNQEFVIDSAKISAKKLEENCHDELDLSLNILVLGKGGVGKSATINSIFGEMKVTTNAFEPATTYVKEVSGTINGVKIRILDTPGLRSHMNEQSFNRKILSSIKRYTKKFPADVVLYVDRVDAQTRDLNDLPMLSSITSSLGPSIWQRAILALTHAASTPSDGPSGSPLSYEVFVAQKSYLVQQSIIQAVGEMCDLSPSFMFPVSLVENHPLCGKNICGECVLPNGLRWRSQLLGLCFSLKILSEMSFVEGPQNLFDHWRNFFFQNQSPPLSHLFSSLLQSPAHLKFSATWN